MAKETERKFLVDLTMFKERTTPLSIVLIQQFYFIAGKDVSARLRISSYGDTRLTIKYNPVGITVDEVEFTLPRDAYKDKMYLKIGREIVKTRYSVKYGESYYEVDIFHDELDGLVVAELECDDAADVVDFPPWIGEEVTHDHRFKNAVLATSDEWKDVIYAQP